MLIQLLVDNKNSWIIPYASKLRDDIISKFNYEVTLINEHDDVKKGNILCLLSCENIFNKLDLNDFNLVVHESNVPKGKGWSPLTWQVIEGKNKIPITLFEAVEKVDAGRIYLQSFIELTGKELLSEIKDLQGKMTIDLILKFLKNFHKIKGQDQKGDSTYYPKRGPIDSELDIDKSIKNQFNLLRVCDNERYPAFFKIDNKKYIIKIFDENE
jgi:methionyl-tRNA formyltransferase